MIDLFCNPMSTSEHSQATSSLNPVAIPYSKPSVTPLLSKSFDVTGTCMLSPIQSVGFCGRRSGGN